MEYTDVQRIAKDTMKYIETVINPGMNLIEIRSLCERKMLDLGADSFWYWDVGAFVFSGDETSLSISGKNYVTSNRIVEENDIITIDLSPQNCDIWGDYARTLVIQNGVVVSSEYVVNSEWKKGLQMETYLHEELYRFAKPSTTFEELYRHMNALIQEKGFINLDFSGNLGHSIEKSKNLRIYIEQGNHAALGSVRYFTFEPHISVPNSPYGYKKENIYYFCNGTLCEL